MSYYHRYYNQLNTRSKRAMAQKMFLLNAFKRKDEWRFIVKGTTDDYELYIDDKLISCTCPDFSQRGKICKHLYFIIGKIAQNVELLNKLETEIEKGSRESKLTREEYDTLSNNLVQRLTQRLSEYGKEPETGPQIPNNVLEDDCSICYDPLSQGKLLQCCDGKEGYTCKNYFHTDCINDWLKRTSSCPMCRRTWNTTTTEKFDPFDKLDVINLEAE